MENERYVTRMTEVFTNRKAVPVIELGYEFITEAPIPMIDEIYEYSDEFEEDDEEFDQNDITWAIAYIGNGDI